MRSINCVSTACGALDSIEEAVRRAPRAPALADSARIVSYLSLWTKAGEIARLLEPRTGPGAIVAVRASSSPSWVAALLGVWRAGCAYLPIDPGYPAERQRFLLADAGASVVLTDDDADALDGVAACRFDASWPGGAAGADVGAERRPTARDLAYVIYTSGSTGTPKGVEVEHEALANLIAWHRGAYGLGPGDRAAQVASVAFDAAVWEVWPTLASGACLLFPDPAVRWDATRLRDWLLDSGITVTFVPTPLAEELLRLEWPARASLRTLLTGGDRLAQRPAGMLPFSLVNHYGPTEATVVTTAGVVAPDGQGLPDIGTPIANLAVQLLDERLLPVADGEAGEICIAGVGLARGYRGQPALTSERFIPCPDAPGGRLYRTGDWARRRPDGRLDFLGRRDAQLKLRGVRIEAGEVEAALAAHAAVDGAAVVLGRAASGDACLVAFVKAGQAGARGEAAELRAWAAARLPEALVPARVEWLDEWPLTRHGKLDREALTRRACEPAARPAAPGARDECAESPDEALLCRCLARALDLPAVGPEDDFFALGGSSLRAGRFVNHVRQAAGVELPLSALFERPTARALSGLLAERRERVTPASHAAGTVTIRPQERHAPFPLTDVQQAYYLGRSDAFELGNVACRLYLEFEDGDVDLARLERAFQRLVERHDMLRAVVDAEGRQRVLDSVGDYRIQRTETAPASFDALRLEWRERLSHEVRDPGAWPLFDLRVLEAPNRRCLFAGFDLLILDGFSLVRLFDEWRRLYLAPDAELPALELTFRDYVLAEREWQGGAAFAAARAYWVARLDTLPAGPALPLFCDPAALTRPRFERREAQLSRDEWAALQRGAARLRATPSALLCAAYARTLARWSRSPHFTLNLTLFNRLPLHPQVEQVLGDFTTLTLLEFDGRAAGPFAEDVRGLQARLWQDLDQRHFSGVRVMREWAARHGLGTAARMPVVFTSLLEDFSALEWLGRRGFSITQTPQVWLDHVVMEHEGGLRFHWDAVQGLFPPGVLDDMFAAYVGALRELAEDAGAWHRPALRGAPAVQARRMAEANAASAPVPDGLLHEPFLAAASRWPERVAVRAGARELTYDELRRRAARVGRRLRDDAARPSQRVAVVMEKGWEQVVAVLGVLWAGDAYVPLDPDLPAERRAALLARAGVGRVLTQRRVFERVTWPDGVAAWCVDDEAEWERQVETAPTAVRSAGDLAYVIFTSGSTGQPKGVMIDHRGALNTVVDLNARLGLGPTDASLGLSSLSFDLSVYDIFGTLAAGATLVLPDADGAREPEHWLACLLAARVSVWNSVPALLGLLVDHLEARARAGRPAPPLDELRHVLLSGDWIPTALPGRLRALAPRAACTSLGGATEASIWSIAHPLGERPLDGWSSVPYGRALTNQSVHVLDDEFNPCAEWVPGQIHIGGVGLALGYLGDEEKTAAAFVRHPRSGERLYRTGDLGRWRPEGVIEFLGREDTQVKVQGYRIELGEVEAALLALPGVREAVALAQGARDGDRHLLAFYVPEPAGAASEAELRAGLARRLPAYMLPSRLEALERIPLTANGKVDRQALLRRADERAALAAPTEGLAGPAPVEVVAALASEVLGRPVPPDADLAELGAASIDLMRLAGLLERRFGVRPSMAELFRLPSVAALAARFAERADAAPRERDESSADERRAREFARATPFLFDPAERAAFRRRRVGRREPTGAVVAFEGPPLGGSEQRRADLAATRRTVRRFAREPLEAGAFDALLALLAERPQGTGRKFLYGSAGGLYPVQTYVYVHPRGVSGVEAGTYYFDPQERRLVTLGAGHVFGAELHFDVNRQVFAEAAFSLHFVADLGAIAPLYGAKSRDYCLLEAGLMTQLLEMEAAGLGIGLCQVGELAFEPARAAFQLEPRHLLMHTLLGGPLGALAAAEGGDDEAPPDTTLGVRTPPAPAGAPPALPQVQAEPQARHEPFPLLEMQQALWVGRSGVVDLGQVSTHAYFEFDGMGLDAERLERAWRRLVERHEMLRAVVQPDGRQRVLAQVPEHTYVALEDLSGLDESERAARLEATRERLSHQVLPTDRWPLFESVLSRLPGGRARYHLSLDSQFIDALSGDILFAELGRLYADPDAALQPLELTFRDYAAACRRLRETRAWAEARDYWLGRLDALPPAPQLPLARVAPAAPGRFERLASRLDAGAWRRLEARARQAGLTPSGVLCTAFADVLGAWSAEPRFTLNLTVYNRWPLHPQVHRLIGQFTGVELLEVDALAADSFAERAERVQQRLWQDLEQRAFHGVEVLRELGRRRGEPAAARMPVVFTSMLNQPAPERGARPWRFLGERVFDITQTPQVWIEHDTMEEDGELVFYWDHLPQVFAEGVVPAMFAAYCEWLQRLVEDDGAWHGPTPDFVPEAQRRRRAGANAQVLDLPAENLPGLLARRLEGHAEAEALIDGRRRLTHAALEGESLRLAGFLRARGAGPGTRVAVVADKGWEQVVALLGVLHAGAAYVPLDASVPSARLRALLEHAQTDLVLTQSWVAARHDWPDGVRCVSLDAGLPAGDGAPLAAPPADALACLIYTSGSSGAPKGVCVTQRAMVSVACDTNARFGIGPSDRVLSVTGLHHDMAAYDVFGLLAAGGSLVLPDPGGAKDPAHWCQRLEREGATLWNSVPALLGMLLAHIGGRPGLLPAGLRWAFVGGDWIPLSLPGELALLAPGARVVSVGGPTETTIWNICHVVDQVDPRWASIPYGRPLANQSYHVLDADLRERPDLVPGEMYCGGLGVAAGYWRDAERTRDSFIVHPRSGARLYRTGDLGRWCPDGTLEFLGRRDLQVKVLGYRVELTEVEAAAQALAGVRAAAVVAVGPERGDKRLVGFYVPAPDGLPGAAEVQAHVAASLPAQMAPAAWHALPALPLTAAGKVDRRALLALAAAESAPAPVEPGDEEPADALEAELAARVARTLGLGRVLRHDDFFALGGNSLTAIQLIAQLREAFHVELQVARFFEEPHVAGLARGVWEALLAQPGAEEMVAQVEALAPGEAQAALALEAPERARGGAA